MGDVNKHNTRKAKDAKQKDDNENVALMKMIDTMIEEKKATRKKYLNRKISN